MEAYSFELEKFDLVIAEMKQFDIEVLKKHQREIPTFKLAQFEISHFSPNSDVSSCLNHFISNAWQCSNSND